MATSPQDATPCITHDRDFSDGGHRRAPDVGSRQPTRGTAHAGATSSEATSAGATGSEATSSEATGAGAGASLVLSSARLRPALLAVMALVVTAGVGAEVLGAALGLRTDEGLVPMLSLSYEWNLPTVYSAALLLVSALLAALAGAGASPRDRTAWHWRALAAGFVLMGLDELLQFHESAAGWSGLGHVIHYDWVVPAAALVAVLGAAFVPFLRRLPGRTRRRLLVAGAVYVGGAVAMELPLGWWAARHGSHGLGYGLIDALEESLEMLGLNLFLVAMVDHLAEKGLSVSFALAPPRGDA